jgi:hypothetical protein
MAELTGLGRRHALDSRDAQYRLEPKRATGIEKRMWYKPPVLDQGATSECVGHAVRSYLDAGPVTNKGKGPDQRKKSMNGRARITTAPAFAGHSRC